MRLIKPTGFLSMLLWQNVSTMCTDIWLAITFEAERTDSNGCIGLLAASTFWPACDICVLNVCTVIVVSWDPVLLFQKQFQKKPHPLLGRKSPWPRLQWAKSRACNIRRWRLPASPSRPSPQTPLGWSCAAKTLATTTTLRQSWTRQRVSCSPLTGGGSLFFISFMFLIMRTVYLFGMLTAFVMEPRVHGVVASFANLLRRVSGLHCPVVCACSPFASIVQWHYACVGVAWTPVHQHCWC